MLDENALINKYAKKLNGKDDGKLTTKPTLYLIQFNISVLNLNIQTYKIFKKIYTILYIQHTYFPKNLHIFAHSTYTIFNLKKKKKKKKNLYNFSKNIHNYVHSTYTFYKNVLNFVYSTNTILYIKRTQIFIKCMQFCTFNKYKFSKNVHNLVH